MRLSPALPLLALLLVFPTHEAAAVPDLVRTLPNKATLIVREVHTRPIVSIQAWVRAGTRDESVKDRGLAAGTAQCIMEATTKRDPGEMQKEVFGLAGTYSSEAGYDYSYFNLTVPSRSLGTGLDLLAEGVTQARLDKQVVDVALGRAEGYSRTVLSSTDGVSVNSVRARLHEGNPLSSPLAVKEEEFSVITPTLIQRFYHDYYVAENLTLVVTGDVDAEEVAEKVSAAFQGMPRGKASSRSRISDRPFQNGPRVALERDPAGLAGAAITIGFPAPPWGSADALALDALMAVLVDSPISRTQAHINAGNSEFIRAAAIREYETDGGTIALTFAVDPDSVQDAEGAVLNLIEQARSTPITQDEFQAAMRLTVQRDLAARSDQGGVGRALALASLRGAPGSDDVYVQRMRALRPEDLVAVARKYLDIRRAVVVELGPEAFVSNVKVAEIDRRIREKQSVYEVAYRTGPQATASADAERMARIDAPLRAAAAAKAVSAGGGRVVRTLLPGGTRLLASEDHSAPLVTVAVYLMGGVRYENDVNNGITALVRETLLNTNDPEGKGRTYRQTLSSMGAMLSYQDKDMWGCSVTVPSDSWRDATKLLGSMFTHPDLDTVNVDATRIYVLDALDRWLHDDEAQRQRLIFPTKYQVSGYRLPGLGTHKTLVSIPHPQVGDWYRTFVVQPNMVIAVFGDVNPSEVQPEVERSFHDIPAKPFQPGTVAQEGEFEGFREKWELGAGPTSTVTIAFNGPNAHSPDVPAIYVVASLLAGPRGWLQQYVMTTGGAKGVNAVCSQALDECPLLSTVVVGGPLQEEDMVKLMFRQIKKAALLPLHGDLAPDLVRAKTLAAGGYDMALDSNPTRALQFARSELFGLGIDYPILLSAKIEGITSNDLLRIGLKYFQKDQWTRAPYAICETRPGGW